MKLTSLTSEERSLSGFTHRAEFNFNDTDLALAATSATISIAAYTVGTLLKSAAFYVPTTFTDGAATMSNCTLKVGYDGTAVDDDDGIIEAAELEATGTEVFGGDATGAIFATKRTGIVFQESGTIKAIFTATGANLSTLTGGKVIVFLELIDLAKL